jgi:hypothetical protein
VHLFPRLDGSGEGMDNVDEQCGVPMVKVPFSDEGSTTWGDGLTDEVWVIKHGTGSEESKGFAGSLGHRGCFNRWDSRGLKE